MNQETAILINDGLMSADWFAVSIAASIILMLGFYINGSTLNAPAWYVSLLLPIVATQIIGLVLVLSAFKASVILPYYFISLLCPPTFIFPIVLIANFWRLMKSDRNKPFRVTTMFWLAMLSFLYLVQIGLSTARF